MKLHQKGFAALELILVLVIVGLIAGVGYFVLQSNQKANTTLSSASSATQTKVPKSDSVISIDKSQLPSGWKAVVATPATISLADTSEKCTVLVSQTASPSLNAAAAQAFVQRKLAALSEGNSSTLNTTVGAATDQTVGGQTVAMHPVTAKDTSKTPFTDYQKIGYVVGKGYYVSVIETCPAQTTLSQADAALQAVTIKS
jgi:prepilin-type N-terminal cleavage/methylation domain-containing protein